MSGTSRRARRTAVLAMAAAVVVGGGVAAAAIPGTGGVITGCFDKSGGNLRVIDAAGSCKSNETRIQWNEQGPAGAQGVAGPAGSTGAQGAKGDPGDTGPAGPTGPAGEQGPAGPQGEQGPAGPQGEQGPAGSGLESFDDLVGLPCREGRPQAGVIEVTYDVNGSAALTCQSSTKHTLTVVVDDPEYGEVRSSPAGIVCGTDCTHVFTPGTTVLLTADPTSSGPFGSSGEFVAWAEGPCRGQRTLTCAVPMTADVTVRADFGPSR